MEPVLLHFLETSQITKTQTNKLLKNDYEKIDRTNKYHVSPDKQIEIGDRKNIMMITVLLSNFNNYMLFEINMLQIQLPTAFFLFKNLVLQFV